MSLRFKLLIPLVLASLMALAYLNLDWSPRALESGKQGYLNEVSHHLDTVIEGLVPLILTQQLDLVHENLDALGKNNHQWTFILLTNKDAKQLFPPLIGGVAQPPPTGKTVHVLVKDIRAFEKTIGRLTVHVDFGTRLAEIKVQQRQLTLMLGMTIALLAMTWLVALEIAVVQPLKRLSAAAAALAGQQFDAILPRQGGDEVGRMVGSFSAMRDDIKESHDELRRYKAIIDSSADAIIGKSLQGIILNWNHGAEMLFGYSAQQAVGQPMLMLMPPELVNEEVDILAHIAKGEKVEHFETVRRHRDGHLIDISATVSPILDEKGVPVGASQIARDITERKHMQDQVRQLAFYDVLTNLPNRRLLSDRIKHDLARSARSGCYGAVMFMDLDNFKALNDSHGHAAGDLLLIEVAHRLINCVREMDTVARLGGDEFVVMVSELDASHAASTQQAQRVAEKIRVALAEPYLMRLHKPGQADVMIEHHCTASIGVTLFLDHEASEEDLLKWADSAMYQAKANGRNTVRFFHDASPA
ncbi:MAG: diguanylate cyclase [Rhodoferax sp.]|jgi:diguanylate cyclase (GGDEF)-like protein/PAS domain S-box-containing protein|uniref:diguanylate cyclase domain-containing protein n=1 Tax=Rhodoferax sp. TaxID=50421 RepID=UPI001B57CD53|nr:diguanylate cyclase [Rhodoferax sp.]MBP9148740.1 diguanylate cyclase [Rhodoferax sp.]MBP9737098.1 diguanylate cyclase [Rhodoferax sp.]